MRLVSHLYQRLMVKLQRGDAYMPGKLFSAAFDRLVSWLNQENSSCFSVNQKTKDSNSWFGGLVMAGSRSLSLS